MGKINRGWLKNQVKKGNIVGRTSYKYGYDDSMYDVHGKKSDPFVPVRYRKDNEEFKEGTISLDDWSFKSKSGVAYGDKEGIIHFGRHSNESFEFKMRKK